MKQQRNRAGNTGTEAATGTGGVALPAGSVFYDKRGIQIGITDGGGRLTGAKPGQGQYGNATKRVTVPGADWELACYTAFGDGWREMPHDADGFTERAVEVLTDAGYNMQSQEPTTRTTGADTGQHTPGEWVRVTGQFGPYIVAQSPGRDVIVAKLHYSMTPDVSEAEGRANHCLLATAPELLAGLKEAREVLLYAVQESRGKVAKEKVGGWEHHANKLGKLITKAGGAL